MSVTLAAIRECLEGAVPATIATVAPDGIPNVSYVSEVHFVDDGHVALSYQFFNKTRTNVLANARATVLVIHPETGAQYRLSLVYLRTETSGPLFETMKAKLAGIASHTGMQGIFRLRGSDVYRVAQIESLPGITATAAAPRRNLLTAIRRASQQLAGCADLDELLDQVLAVLQSHFGVGHAMVFLQQDPGGALSLMASCGYAESGVGSDVAAGDGLIGLAAREAIPIRITHSTADYRYGRAVRDNWPGAPAAEIPLPGLPEPGSQLAVPIASGRQVLGVLYLEDAADGAFGYDEEDALVTLASQVAAALQFMRAAASEPAEAPAAGAPASAPVLGPPLRIRYYPADDSVFIDEDYLIKGVAGAIFWKLVCDHHHHGRTEFTNRELRLDPAIHLPEFSENLEARLVLLRRRLQERQTQIRIERTGRGRFRLQVRRPLQLATAGAARGAAPAAEN